MEVRLKQQFNFPSINASFLQTVKSHPCSCYMVQIVATPWTQQVSQPVAALTLSWTHNYDRIKGVCVSLLVSMATWLRASIVEGVEDPHQTINGVIWLCQNVTANEVVIVSHATAGPLKLHCNVHT